MRGTRSSWIVRLAVAAVVAVGCGVMGGAGGDAQAGTSASNSRPSSSSWQSKSSQPRSSGALWDRSTSPSSVPGSGVTSGGYAKPSLASPANSNVSSGAAVSSGGGAVSSGGYAKPAAVGAGVVTGASATAMAAGQTPANSNVPSAANSNTPVASVGASGGYTKPGGVAIAPEARSGAPLSPAVAPSAPAGVTSSGGYAKPALGTGTPPAVGGGNGSGGGGSAGGGKPPTGTGGTGTAALRPPTSALDRGAERQLSTQSMARYKAEQQRFAAPAQGTLTGASDYARNPLYGGNVGRYRSYDQAYAERDIYRNSHPWAPPTYVYHSAPSFGMWDAMFLWMILDKIHEPSHAAAAYNNQNDPGFQAWRREADRMAQDNAELKAKLAAMDAKLTTMQGQPQKPGTLPEGVPAAVALAPEVVVAPQGGASSALVVGTGGVAGNYYPFCQGGASMSGLRGSLKGLTVDCRVTNGSVENMDGLVDGTFDAVLVQSDVYNEWLGLHPGVHLDALQATIYREYVQMLANKQAGVDRIGDLDPKRHVIYLVGSGAQKTWDGFVAQNSKYNAFEAQGRLRRVPGDAKVLDTVAANPDAVMVFVSGLKSDLLREANQRLGNKLTMVLVDDSRLDDAVDRSGNHIYAFAKIPSGVYPNLQKSRWFGMTSSVPSLTVGAVFILSERWVAEHGVAGLSKVEDALWKTIPEIEAKVGVGG